MFILKLFLFIITIHMWLIIPFRQSDRIHEKVVSKCNNPNHISPSCLKMLWPQSSTFSKPLPLILLKSIGCLLWSCCFYCLFPLFSCCISISFLTIKGTEISCSPFSFYTASWSHYSLIVGWFFVWLIQFALFCQWPLICTTFRRHLHYFVSLNCLGRHYSPGCTSPYLSIF